MRPYSGCCFLLTWPEEQSITGADLAAADVDLDVVPVVERAQDLGGRFRVRRLQVAQRLVGEHDAPAEGVVRAVALHHGNLVRRVMLLHEQREIQSGRSPADAHDVHVRSRWMLQV